MRPDPRLRRLEHDPLDPATFPQERLDLLVLEIEHRYGQHTVSDPPYTIVPHMDCPLCVAEGHIPPWRSTDVADDDS